MRVVPLGEVLEKLSAIQHADALGRQLAQDQATEKLAGMVGVFMADTQSKMGMDKLAQSMVLAGELSLEEYEMLKEAGWGTGLKAVGKGLKRLVTGAPARGASRDVAGLAAKPGLAAKAKGLVKRKPKPAVSRGSRDVSPQAGAAYNARAAQARKQHVMSPQPAATPAPGRVAPAPAAVAPAPMTPRSGATNPSATTVAAATPGKVAPAPSGAARSGATNPSAAEVALATPGGAMAEGRVVRRVRGAQPRPQRAAPIVETKRRVAPSAAPGRVAPTPQAAPAPGKVAPAPKQAPPPVAAQQAPAASAPGKVAPTSQATATQASATQQAPGKVAPAAQTAAKPAAKKGTGWGRALPYAAVGGLAYGAYKGVPWAARQLEHTSTTPLAQNAGWSPVSYGYGYTPYGPGMQTMGGGA